MHREALWVCSMRVRTERKDDSAQPSHGLTSWWYASVDSCSLCAPSTRLADGSSWPSGWKALLRARKMVSFCAASMSFTHRSIGPLVAVASSMTLRPAPPAHALTSRSHVSRAHRQRRKSPRSARTSAGPSSGCADSVGLAHEDADVPQIAEHGDADAGDGRVRALAQRVRGEHKHVHAAVVHQRLHRLHERLAGPLAAQNLHLRARRILQRRLASAAHSGNNMPEAVLSRPVRAPRTVGESLRAPF